MRSATLLALVLALASCAGGGGKAVLYEANGRTFEGYYVSPAPDAPLILLVHDWDGLTEYEMTRAGMLAELGYAVFAADLFGAGVRPESLEEKQRLTSRLYQNREEMRLLLYAALEAARAQGGDIARAVAMGYCFGGAAVLELARSGADLRGFVTFHGGLRTPEGQDYSQAKGQFLIFHGTADESVSMKDFTKLAQELEEAGLPHEMITYGQAPHAFTVFGTSRYREDADRKSWERFSRFLEEVLR
jgi:dienelactone hydrolase